MKELNRFNSVIYDICAVLNPQTIKELPWLLSLNKTLNIEIQVVFKVFKLGLPHDFIP